MVGCRYCGARTHTTLTCNHTAAAARRSEEARDAKWSEFVLTRVIEAVEQVLAKYKVPSDLVTLMTQSLLVKAGRLSRPTELRFARQNKANLPKEIIPKRIHHKL